MKRIEEFDKSVTLTPDEASKIMRDAGIKICTETLRDGLEQGAFPFGIFIQKGARTFFISRKKLFEWLYDFCGYVPGEETA